MIALSKDEMHLFKPPVFSFIEKNIQEQIENSYCYS